MKQGKALSLISLLSLLVGTTGLSFSQSNSGPIPDEPEPIQESLKYGALAIERDNGSFFAWAVDCATLEEAKQKSVEECIKKGGKCSVVLTFSGTCCAAYRTSAGQKIGLAFGWGVAPTKEEADVIAKREHLLRSFGMACPNVVYFCNSPNSGTFKQIYNASAEIQSLPGEEEDY